MKLLALFLMLGLMQAGSTKPTHIHSEGNSWRSVNGSGVVVLKPVVVHEFRWTVVCIGFTGRWCDYTFSKYMGVPEIQEIIDQWRNGKDAFLLIEGPPRTIGQGREWVPDFSEEMLR